jgi:hypothetical protein
MDDCAFDPTRGSAIIKRLCAFSLAGCIVLALAGCGIDKFEMSTDPWEPPPAAASKRTPAPREACNNSVPERQALFGDLHIHSSLSMDANSLGTRTMPDDAYAYATGQEIEVYSGDPAAGVRKTRIDRPLDFAAVTDHAECLAESPCWRGYSA